MSRSPQQPTSTLQLVQMPAPESKSLQNRVGTLAAPYKRRDGKLTSKLQAAVSTSTNDRLRAAFKHMPRHIKFNDFVDAVLGDGLTKFEAEIAAQAAETPAADAALANLSEQLKGASAAIESFQRILGGK